jgi:hypothetical protein
MKIKFKTAWFLVWLSLFGLLAISFAQDGFTMSVYALTVIGLMAAASSFVITVFIRASLKIH